MQGFKNKKGSAIVEAAAVLPFVIISVIALILMMTYFYSQLNERVDMHIALRSECGNLCENMFYNNEIRDDITVYEKSQQIYSNSAVDSKYNQLLKKRRKEIAARKYLIDECKFVRMVHAAENRIEIDEE